MKYWHSFPTVFGVFGAVLLSFSALYAAPLSELLQQQEHELALTVRLPQVKMKETDSAHTSLKSLCDTLPLIESIMRVNSRGERVNFIRKEGAALLPRSFGSYGWFVASKDTLSSWWDTLSTNNGIRLVCARGISVSKCDGCASTFGGSVVLIINPDYFLSIDTTLESVNFKGRFAGDKSVALLNRDTLIHAGAFVLSVIQRPLPARKPLAKEVFAVAETLKKDAPQVSEKPFESNAAPSGRMLASGAAIIGIVGIGLILLLRRKRVLPALEENGAAPPVDESTAGETAPDTKLVVCNTYLEAEADLEEISFASQLEIVPGIDQTFPESVADTTALEEECRAEIKRNISARVLLEEEEMIRQECRLQIQSNITQQIFQDQFPAIKAEVIKNLKEQARQSLSPEKVAEIESGIIDEITQDIRSQLTLRKDELFARESMDFHEKIRQQVESSQSARLYQEMQDALRTQIREEIVNNERLTIIERERQLIREDIIAVIQTNEYADMVDEERRRLRAKIKELLKEKEAAAIEHHERDVLTQQIREKIRLDELDELIGTMRDELTKVIGIELNERERATIYEEQRYILSGQIMQELENKEKDALVLASREILISRIRKSIAQKELPALQVEIKNTIRQQETVELRQQVREEIKRTELNALHEVIKKEIYDDSVHLIKSALDEKYEAQMREKLGALKKELFAQIHREIFEKVRGDFRSCAGTLDTLLRNIADLHTLDALMNRIEFIKNGKRQFKYFNLNTAQTDEMLADLERQCSVLGAFTSSIEDTLSRLQQQLTGLHSALDVD